MALTSRNVTAYGRLSYAHLFEPQAPNENAKPKFSAVLLIPKNDTATIERVQAAIQAAVHDGVERRVFDRAIDPAHTKYPPLRDGDLPNDNGEPRGEEFAGCWFISAKANPDRRPSIVDGQLNKIIDQSEVYSGMYVNMAVQFFAYSNSGNKGISASLVGVQKVKDGEKLGGGAPEAEDVFNVISTGAAPQGGFGQTPQSPAQDGLGF